MSQTNSVYTEVPKHQLSDREKGERVAANGFSFVVEEVRDKTYLLRLEGEIHAQRQPHEEGNSPVSAIARSCAQAGEEYTALDSRAKIAGDLYRGGEISRAECFRLEMDALLGEDSGPIDYDTEPLSDDPRVGKRAERYVGVMRGVE